jgi:para-aminobenzoate synthetase/4-amino-4-deoxychorismate lyase
VRLRPVRRALDFGSRPDPSLGIFETVHVVSGRAPRLAAQLERLRASAHALYGVDLAAAFDRLRPSVPLGDGRLRIAFVPGGGLRVDHGPRGPDPVLTEITPFILPGGLGPHKWLDRCLADALTTAAGPGALPLLLDADGAVLESVRMNVLIEEQGRLVSPPSDGRFRAGFGRAGLRYDEEPVDLDRLLAADAVVLTSALRRLRIPVAD